MKALDTTRMFPDVIGQENVKRKLGFYARNYKANNRIPHLFFSAPKGAGKTHVANAMARLLADPEEEKKAKRYITVNCSELKSLSKFVNEFLIPKVTGYDVTVFFDECHMMPKGIANALLTILNPNKHRRTEYSYEDFDMEFDFTRQSFMMATTEYDKVFEPLKSRFTEITLQEYTLDELGRIAALNLEGYSFEDGVLEDIARVSRGNARTATTLADDIKDNLDMLGTTILTWGVWDFFRYAHNINPLGLYDREILTLGVLRDNDPSPVSVSFVCANVGDTLGTVQNYERMLMKNGLMERENNCQRVITKKGREYMAELDEIIKKHKEYA
jgi:Holliday junction resolvasome RuvABC ATP-dependent DNA helicase subunit